ncbi:hypothetical protein [Aminipila luticellarii]|uniref:Type II secretion system protein GspF domain-containing protein n=1 Tax=Aminipila luticellarii TaxID=2507160 RepID=A0A410PUU2_9FIRM|nr:hypothetical protein [Aminipila luticellarii]QAT42719.1 hypothetical protein EQM06_05450 [Aminipila luticellarii]
MKSSKNMGKWLDALSKKLPDGITGKTKEYEKELYMVYGTRQHDQDVYFMKLHILKKYIFLIGAFTAVLGFVLFYGILHERSAFSIDSEGRKYIERPTYDQGNIRAKLLISGEVEKRKIKKSVILNIKPEGADRLRENIKEKPENLKEDVMGKLDSLIYAINKSDASKAVYLPEDIQGMEKVSWSTDRKNPGAWIIFIEGILLLSIYVQRYDAIKKLKKNCNESIEQELPDFLTKMVLLMNAGLVLTAAFEKIVEDYHAQNYKKTSYFYNQLAEIRDKVTGTNASMIMELKKFAERSRNREFMRITSILSDNIHKGTELVKILQDENNLLWFQRKKSAEERGRIAETKLTMPLALQLLVVIGITLAPAMLEM